MESAKKLLLLALKALPFLLLHLKERDVQRLPWRAVAREPLPQLQLVQRRRSLRKIDLIPGIQRRTSRCIGCDSCCTIGRN